jgi:NADPH:quinone reductase-like Zn-dependent oxidoreductase
MMADSLTGKTAAGTGASQGIGEAVAQTRWVAVGFGGPEVLRRVRVDVPAPRAGEVTIAVRAAGMNPADYKHFGPGQDPSLLPLTVGYEAAGTIAALGPGTEIASGGGMVGDEVVAFQILGGYASAITVSAADVFAKPASLSFAESANLLLVGTTAAEMLHVTGISADDVVLVHGAAGGVGTSVLQQARLLGATVIGTASQPNFDAVRHFGGIPVAYGPGLHERLRAVAPNGIGAALDCVGTAEAIDVSLAVVPDTTRIVSIAAFDRAADGIQLIGARNPRSGPFRASQRARLLALAADGGLTVPIARTFPMQDAPAGVAALTRKHDL